MGEGMEALVHLDPAKCICVLGPQIAAHYLVASGLDSTAIPAVMSHRGLVEAGIRKLMDVDTFEKIEDKQRKEALLKSAYELDPSFPAYKIAERLRELGVYEQWLAEVFSPVANRPAMLGYNSTLDHLITLQRQGLLLVYTHYDPVLTGSQRFRPVHMESTEGVRSWATSARSPTASSGLLYLHGSCGLPASMKWDSLPYANEIGDSPGGKVLKEVCRNRSVIFAGFDADFFDPLLHKFCSTFLPSTVCSPPLLLTSQPGRIQPLASVLTVGVSQLVLEKVLIPVPTSQQGNTTHLYRSQDKCKPIRMTLLYSDSVSGLNSADKIKSMSYVGATQIALSQDEKHHLLTLQVDQRGMESLWKVVFASGSSAIHSRLLGLRLEGGVTVWLAGKGEGGTQERSGGHPEMPTLPLHAPPYVQGSSVSVINSNWTSPISSPSVSKLASTPSPSTRPTLPSPLMNATTKRSPLRGPSSPNLFRSIAVGTSPSPQLSLHPPPPHHHHHQVRRIQSEHDKLSYLDRMSNEEKRRKNGMLIHQESAPAIIAPDNPQTLSVPSPSTLMKVETSLNEHRIECIDRYQQSQAGSSQSSIIPSSRSRTPTSLGDFQKTRQQFINEAMEWSRKLTLSAEMQKTWKAISGAEPLYSSTISIPGGGSTAMSNEEQEKLLRLHFGKMQQLPNLQTFSSHASLSLPSMASNPHLGSLPASSPQESPSHSRPQSKSPRPSPIQLPSSSAALQGSPFNPLSLGAQGLFGYMPPTSALPGLQGLPSPANLMFSPSSQYAALLNQYIQMMSPHSMVGGNKQQQPLVINDPSLLHSLQHAVIVLPDGTIAPANLGMEELVKKKDSDQNSPTKSVGNIGKRSHSPLSSTEALKTIPPPKRRRSSSLPDIAQLSTTADKNPPIQENSEAEERESQKQGEQRVEQMRKREIAPLNMITIPKEMKMTDPMLGFPTPPQSSPHFASSPLILPSAMGMFQPQPMTPITPSQDALSQEEIKELVGESSVQTPLPPSPNGGGLPPFPTGRGPIQLWQFLLDLLISPDKNHMIHWTGNGYEFRIVQPEEIAKLWGARKNKPRMNYDKLSRGLRYYYSKGIMDKVPGKKLTFKYTCDVPHYLRSRSAATSMRDVNGHMHESTISSEA